jgi:hypothetical protein
MKKAEYGAAIAELRSGLDNAQLTQHLQTYPDDMHMANRWDLELWLKVALMRHHLQGDDPVIWKAIQELEQLRSHPAMCWSLDVVGGKGLVNAVEETFSEMGVPPGGSFRGHLVDRREALKRDIAAMMNATQNQVDKINAVLNHLNTEVLQLAQFPKAGRARGLQLVQVLCCWCRCCCA